MSGSPPAVFGQSTVARATAAPEQVARDRKGDRVPVPKSAHDGLAVATVEVLGADNVTLMFRSRFGQVLLHSDPVSNATYVAKDFAWPAFVVRPRIPSPIEERFPETGPGPDRRPQGCEPVSSEVADPHGPRIIGRCIAMAHRAG
jgi:hypothetical protein